MQYKNYFFDLDGTLTESAPGIINAIKYAMNKHGYPIPENTDFSEFIGPPLTESFEKMNCPPDEIADIIASYREYYSVTGLYECYLYDGIEDELKKLCENGGKIFLATSKPEKFARMILAYHRIDKYFTFIGGATFDGTRAKKFQVIDYVLRENGLEKSETVMIGDRHHDIDGAKTNGIHSAGVLYGYGNKEELETAGADYIITTVSDISRIFISLS